MKPLSALKRFVNAKENEATLEALAEVRAYAVENAPELAEAFRTTVPEYLAALEAVGDDAKLARQLLASIKARQGKDSEKRARDVGEAAQEAADKIGHAARWVGDRATLDLAKLLEGALSGKNDFLEFASPNLDPPERIPLAPKGWTVSVPQAPLLRFKALGKRVKGATAYVDKNGLHVRWKTGGLNLRAGHGAKGWAVAVNLPVRAESPVLAEAA